MGYMEATESLKYPYLTTRVTSPSRVVLEVFKFSPSDGALIPLEGPIRRTGEGGEGMGADKNSSRRR
jgi:hypothetical protein